MTLAANATSQQSFNVTREPSAFSFLMLTLIKVPGAYMIDDFCLSADKKMIFGADFLNNTVLSWNTDGSPARKLFFFVVTRTPLLQNQHHQHK